MKKITIILFITILSCGLFSQAVWLHPSSSRQSEPHIAVNPVNANNLVATTINLAEGATKNTIGAYYSNDGGRTWYGVDAIDNEPENAGDPVVAFDSDGIAYLLFQRVSLQKLYLYKSLDGGITWSFLSNPIDEVDLDRPWLAISPVRNENLYYTIYVGCMIIEEDGRDLHIYKSSTGGNSFNQFVSPIMHDDYDKSGISIAIGPNEEVCVAYASATVGASAKVDSIHIRVYNPDQSIDMKNWFTRQIGEDVAGDVRRYKVKDKLIRADSYPRIAIDCGLNSATRGNIYVVWADRPNDSLKAEIRMSKGVKNAGGYTFSSNFLTWDVNVAWMPAIAVSPTGRVSVMYYYSADNREDLVYTKMKLSDDAGSTWISKTVGSFSVNDPNLNDVFVGDYFGITSSLEAVFGIWSEYDDNHAPYHNIQAYTDSINFELIPGELDNHVIYEVSQTDEGEAAFDSLSRWYQGKYTKYPAPAQIVSGIGSEEIFKAKEGFKEETKQKYQTWTEGTSQGSTVNHDNFSIQENQQDIFAEFKNTFNATLVSNLTIPGLDSIKFKDPWLVDYDDSPYGMRNQGMDAPFIIYESGYQITTSSAHKGVFLNLIPDELAPEKPYYTVFVSPLLNTNNVYYVFDTYDSNPLFADYYPDLQALN